MKHLLGVVYDQMMLLHFSEDNTEFERPDRVLKIYEHACNKGLIGMKPLQFRPISSRMATREELLTCHDAEYVDLFSLCSEEHNVAMGGLAQIVSRDQNIYANQYSFDCARLAAGSVLSLCESVVAGTIQRGVALVRPPGHHACNSGPMGFCFFNNVALGAKYLAAKGHSTLIIDWDIHHGNGTEASVCRVPGIAFYSIHRFDYGQFYPGTGVPCEYDNIKNVGFCGNPKGNAEYKREFSQIQNWLSRIACKPTVILVSAGFDAAEGDPLGGYHVTPEGYAELTRILLDICPKVLLVLEGGYNMESISNSMIACMEELSYT